MSMRAHHQGELDARSGTIASPAPGLLRGTSSRLCRAALTGLLLAGTVAAVEGGALPAFAGDPSSPSPGGDSPGMGGNGGGNGQGGGLGGNPSSGSNSANTSGISSAGNLSDGSGGTAGAADKSIRHPYPLDQAQALVTGLYENQLLREPDAGGLDNWSSQLTAGALSYDEVAADIVGSTEAQQVRALLAISPEATNSRQAYPLVQAQALVGALYESVLSRLPDPTGLDYWGSRLASGQASYLETYAGIYQSPEADALRQARSSSSSTP